MSTFFFHFIGVIFRKYCLYFDLTKIENNAIIITIDSKRGLRSMKNLFKCILLVILSCLCLFPLASCGNGIKGDEAKAFINDFFDAIVAEDYEKAEGFLHPDRPADLETFLLNVEKEENVDFQSGIKIEKYTGFSSSLYDSTVDGSRYELTMRTTVGNKEVKFTVEIVKNENGYGIYNLNIDT